MLFRSPNVDAFEKEAAAYTGAEYAVALSSGTAAIHLALKSFGVETEDIVFCSSLTFSASCNPIAYLGAKPVFIDSDESLIMSPNALRRALLAYPKPKAIITVNLYGQSCDYDAIREIAGDIPILEDAAESLGATYKRKQTGTLGDFGVLSFNGNKIITTSGGGMLLCKTKEQADKIKFWATQARDHAPWYEHSEIGYNYRMSNVCAGIGRGQMEVIDTRIAQKRAIFDAYKERLSDIFKWMPERDNSEQTRWLTVGILKNENVAPMDIVNALESENIEARPVWKPMHMQPVYNGAPYFTAKDGKDVSAELFKRGVCLPSDPKMTDKEIERVCAAIRSIANI